MKFKEKAIEIIVVLLFFVVFIGIPVMALVSITSEIHRNGGLASSIGKFINNVKSEID